ncbi:hypothetical protein NPIL_12601 [Nephila pilipes]|uniref:Uncharacterized protein n=1 Tax=Nephila pilipes TaxID=299642 RepID=A0A8X6UNI7_NEPPI|nr:hypothetical protein NPIL_12601 [Nephila pilipes]
MGRDSSWEEEGCSLFDDKGKTEPVAFAKIWKTENEQVSSSVCGRHCLLGGGFSEGGQKPFFDENKIQDSSSLQAKWQEKKFANLFCKREALEKDNPVGRVVWTECEHADERVEKNMTERKKRKACIK